MNSKNEVNQILLISGKLIHDTTNSEL